MKEQNGTPSRSALRRQREREQRLKTILAAAETLFGRKGYHQTSIEEIADMAEVSTGAVYFYFKNKEDLLITLMQDIGYDLRKLLGDELRKAELSLESLRNIAVAFLNDFCLRYPEKITIFFRESVGQSAEVEEQRKKLFIRLSSDIREAVIRIASDLNREFVTDASPELIAVCIVGIYERIACHYLLWRGHPEDLVDIAEETVSFMLGGVTNLFRSYDR
ncbi:MAG: TetR/AcrR family transcriptional regulator [Deltaproteobacteria bacterium]|nr:TetR/AcrR family transcriptional regulator [Deltaproteobacteria bacterium]